MRRTHQIVLSGEALQSIQVLPGFQNKKHPLRFIGQVERPPNKFFTPKDGLLPNMLKIMWTGHISATEKNLAASIMFIFSLHNGAVTV